ncbi:hypothetical protein [Nocardia salmonicida]|uniref:hypothetical protein n=1 Tax=Nocardia salmonicida TaxID=53431 RepID=UPI0007A3FC19|nr:hypothetical protein [Nocardia salmonicida]
MRFTVPTIVSTMAAVLLTGCSLFPQGPDQAERDRWSRVIETAIEALPGVADASHTFQYHPYGPNSYYTSRLDVRLEDGATPAETASVVRAMGAQQLPPHYRGDSTMFKIHRMTDSFSGDWRLGRGIDVEANAAYTWTRVSAADTGAEIHWATHGVTATGDAGPPGGEKLSTAQATQLADRHLRYLARPGAVVDYTIVTRDGPRLAVLVGGCPASEREVAPESEPFARQYERC